jgi:K+-transporting ATPase ATPase C chain
MTESSALSESTKGRASESVPYAKQVRPAIISVFCLSLLTGCIFPLALFAIARPLFPRQAAGSLITRGGVVVGSELIGQEFAQPWYFQSRPSAAGKGYDATSSGGTNLGPNNPKLIDGAPDFPGIRRLADEYRSQNAIPSSMPIPADAVTRSASGLDPHISPANAELQISRVARARGIDQETVRRLVAAYTQGPQLVIFGSPRISVLKLNLALDDLAPKH